MNFVKWGSALVVAGLMAGAPAAFASDVAADQAASSAHDKKDGFLSRVHNRLADGKKAVEEKASSAKDAVKKEVAPVTSSAGVVFPSRISAEFASLAPGRARLKTCAAQYSANKANGGNGKLLWIQRGGGYWSQCNAHLKG